MKEQNISACTELKNIIDGFGTVQTAWGLIVAVTLIIAFIFCDRPEQLLKSFAFISMKQMIVLPNDSVLPSIRKDEITKVLH